MEGYRVDRRDFSKGDTIASHGKFMSELTTKKKKVEEVLESKRPGGKLSRKNGLFIFESKEPALKHWLKMEKGKLYQVYFDDYSHRGDMAKTEEIYKSLDEADYMEDLAEDYWNELMSSDAEVELIVDSAEVVEIISKDEEERRDELKRRWGFLR